MDFYRKAVLITGASRGIGAQLAVKYFELGAKVVVNYLNSAYEAQRIFANFKDVKDRFLLIKADVSSEKAIKVMVAKIIDKFGRIDILINNAGSVFEPSNWKEINKKVFMNTLSVNLFGVFNCMKNIVPIMLKNKYGKVVNVSSVAGITGALHAPAYSAAKAGVIALTKGFALETAPYINVNAIAPSWVNTSWHKNKDKTFFNEIEKLLPLKKIAEVDDIVSLILFLTSEESRYITGQTIIIDGGLTVSRDPLL